LTNSQTTNPNTLYGSSIALTDSGSLANTDVGLNVDLTGVSNTSASKYAAIFNGGNVGIGTTTPAYKLDLATSTANDRGINISNTASSGTNYGLYSSITGAATTNYAGYFTASGAGTNYALYTGTGNNYFGTNGALQASSWTTNSPTLPITLNQMYS